MDRGAFCFALSGLILVLSGLSTSKWLDYPGQEANPQEGLERQSFLQAGLWTVRFEIYDQYVNDYVLYSLDFTTDLNTIPDDIKEEYEWFYGSWINSARALAIITVIWGAGTIALHFWKTLRTHDYFWSKIIFLNYLFTCKIYSLFCKIIVSSDSRNVRSWNLGWINCSGEENC